MVSIITLWGWLIAKFYDVISIILALYKNRVISHNNNGWANSIPLLNLLSSLGCGSYIVISSVILLCLVWQ